MNTPTTTAPAPAAPPPKKRGCFFYGCLTMVVLALIAGVLAFFAVRSLKNLVNTYTDTAPMELPKVEMPEVEFKALQERLTAFGEAMEKGTATSPLILTEREINALIANSPDMKELADKVYVSIDGNQVKGQVSIPLDNLPLPWVKGRYLNGAATFDVSLENGVLIVTAESIEVKGKPLPEKVMAELRKENLAKDAYNDPETAEAIRKFESIQVEDDKVIVRARGKE